MSIFDTKTYNIDTNDIKDTVLLNLRRNIDKERIFRFETTTDKPFKGSLQGDKFKVQRITNYRSSFVPMIEGQVSQRSYGTNINLKIYINPIVQVFMAIWILLIIGFIGLILLTSLTNTIALIALPILIVIALIGLSSGDSIKKEREKSEKLLFKIIKSEKPFNPNFKISND
jgi:hypothetical protein